MAPRAYRPRVTVPSVPGEAGARDRSYPRDVAVTFGQIESDFEAMRDFFLNDLMRILAQETGGNFAVAALVAIAHEEIAWIRHGHREGELSFEETLSRDFGPLGRALYGALRDWLVHGYRTKTIRYDGKRVEIGVAWRGEHHEHYEATFDGGEEGDFLSLSAPRLVFDLGAALDRLEADLRADPNLRDRFRTQRRKDRERHVRGAEADKWRELLRGS
jgi:hypothetical protein